MNTCPWFRRPPFRHHGRKIIAGLCGYELLALPRRSPFPTISEFVNRRRWVGVALIALLGQHWFLELVEDAVEEAQA